MDMVLHGISESFSSAMHILKFELCIQRYRYRVLPTIQMKLILLCVLAEPAILASTKTALKFKCEI